MVEQIIFFVTSFFKGATINKKMRLKYELLNRPEIRILSSFGYINYLME